MPYTAQTSTSNYLTRTRQEAQCMLQLPKICGSVCMVALVHQKGAVVTLAHAWHACILMNCSPLHYNAFAVLSESPRKQELETLQARIELLAPSRQLWKRARRCCQSRPRLMCHSPGHARACGTRHAPMRFSVPEAASSTADWSACTSPHNLDQQACKTQEHRPL